jgi:predicted amidophosphoribosyltransferase
VCLACFEQVAAGDRAPGPGGRCGACGRPGRLHRPCANPLCTRADRGWSAVFALGVHRAALRRSIAGYKYRGERWWAGVFARLLAGYLRAHPLWFEEYDVVVPMPAYRGRGARRAWDPVGCLFADLVAIIGSEWDCDDGLIAKVTETPPMSGRTRWERAALAEAALRPALVVPDRRRVAGRRILVVDDVLTEGSSLREVAMALRTAGAEEVAGLVLARRGRDAPAPADQDHAGRRSTAPCPAPPAGPVGKVSGWRPIWSG